MGDFTGKNMNTYPAKQLEDTDKILGVDFEGKTKLLEPGSASLVDVGTGALEVPTNGDLGSASLVDTGTGADEVPTNANLGSASLVDVGTALTEVPTNADLGSASLVDVGQGDGEILTNNLPQATRSVSANTTLLAYDYVLNVSANASTSRTVTVPASLSIGKRFLIRRLGAYDTSNTNKLTINFSGGEVCTPEQLSSIELYGDGGNWLIEKVAATRWEIVAGWDAGENTNGTFMRTADGAQSCKYYYTDTVSINNASGIGGYFGDGASLDFAIEFSSKPHLIASTTRGPAAAETDRDADTSASQYQLRFRTIVSRTGETVYSNINAVGRWYELV